MGTYSYLLTAARYHDIVKLFAQKDPDVRVEMNWGVYDGIEGVKRCYSKFHAEQIVGAGVMAVHALTTPVIEVAGDLKTAKAVWISPGHITGGPFTPDGVIRAHWAWMRYGQRLSLWKTASGRSGTCMSFGIFMCPVDKKLGGTGRCARGAADASRVCPDRPPTYSWSYSPKVETELVPVALRCPTKPSIRQQAF